MYPWNQRTVFGEGSPKDRLFDKETTRNERELKIRIQRREPERKMSDRTKACRPGRWGKERGGTVQRVRV